MLWQECSNVLLYMIPFFHGNQLSTIAFDSNFSPNSVGRSHDLWNERPLVSMVYFLKFMLKLERHFDISYLYLILTGSRIFFTSRCTVCWCKVGDPSCASPSWLSCQRADHALPPWWVGNLCHFGLASYRILFSLLNYVWSLILPGQSKNCGVDKKSLHWHKWLGLIIRDTFAGTKWAQFLLSFMTERKYLLESSLGDQLLLRITSLVKLSMHLKSNYCFVLQQDRRVLH